MNSNNQLPPAWKWTTLGAICTKPQYGWTTSASLSGSIKLLRTTDISGEQIDWSSVPYCQKNPPDIDKFQVRSGDIVISRAGAGVGVSALLLDPPKAVFASYLIRFHPLQVADSRYIAFFLKTQPYKKAIADNAAGIAQPNVNATKLSRIAIPLPPLTEQLEIVAEIEKHLTRLISARQALKHARTNLKLYRASTLKDACMGALFPPEAKEYRASVQNSASEALVVPAKAELSHVQDRPHESANILLERILKQRHDNWQGNKAYKEPFAPRDQELGRLPDGWCWASVSQVALLDVGYAFKSSEFKKKGIRLLRGENIEPGALRWLDVQYWPKQKLDSYRSLIVNEGDIILAMDRPLISTGLKIARAKKQDVPCLLVQRVARIRGIAPAMTSYLFVCLRTLEFIQHLIRGQTGSQLPHISAKGIASFVFPLPPLVEQQRIASEVERRLSVADKVENWIEASLVRADRLRESILHSAFQGSLIRQASSKETQLENQLQDVVLAT